MPANAGKCRQMPTNADKCKIIEDCENNEITLSLRATDEILACPIDASLYYKYE
jgi:hypothetical protein